ncbi:MAG: hypothetical protein LKE40_10655 [Spirochaetia bacterium]|jgi:hypothetical protein|nr:hypothetical protein [Spirochaetia bacterium]
MVVDAKALREIGNLDWNTVPVITSGVSKGSHFRAGKFEFRLLRNPLTQSDDALIDVVYSMVVLLEDRLVLFADIERDNLRELAFSLGCSPKTLQEEYGTHTYFGPLRAVVYSADEKEEQEAYNGTLEVQDVRVYLADLLMDTLDCLDEMVPMAD